MEPTSDLSRAELEELINVVPNQSQALYQELVKKGKSHEEALETVRFQFTTIANGVYP